MNTLGAIFSAIASVFNWRRQRDEQQNTPEIKANAAAETRAEIAEKANAEVAQGDIESIRKDLAE